MATGENIQRRRGIEVSNIAPQVNLDTGDAENWQRAGQVFDRLTEAAKPDLMRRAAARGEAEGLAIASGEQEYSAPRFQFGDAAAARQAALETAYSARTRQDIDAREREVRRQYRYDPDGYDAAMKEVVSGFIQGAPSEFAVDVEGYAQGKASEGLTWVADQRAVRDEQEVIQATATRAATLAERMIAIAAKPGGRDSFEFLQAAAEYGALQEERMANPAILYSEEQRAADDDKVDVGVMGSEISRNSVQVYTDNGGGLPGMAAATRFLTDEVLNGEAFAELTPESRQALFRNGQQQLRDFYAVAREERRVEQEEERIQREERRELVGDYRLRVAMGEATEADIMADETLLDADKATLVNGARAQARRERTELRAVEAMERAGVVALYNEFRDQAQAGTLTAGEIADALGAGQLTQGQAATLRTMNDRSLRPVVDDVLAPVRDASRAPGRSMRGQERNMAIAEEAATMFARSNPDATLNERLQAGEAIARRVYGAPGAGRPSTPQAAAQGQAAQLQALSAERNRLRTAGTPMSTADYNRRRNEIINGS